MTLLNTNAADVHGLVVYALNKHGYRPFGSDGSAWEHPDGTKVTTGYTGGQLRLRRLVPGTDRVVWDIRDTPSTADVEEFIGQRRDALPLTPEQMERLELIEMAEDAPESFRQRIIAALGDEMDTLGLSPGRFYASPLADAVLAVIRGER